MAKLNKPKVINAAQKYVQKGQYDRAIREYQKIVDEDPRDVRIWLKIGDLYAKKKATGEAVDTYLKVAEFYSEQGFYLKAVAVYKQVLKLSPNSVENNLRLAELYKQLGLLNDAMKQYELVSNNYNREGRTKDALAAVRQIVDLDPENIASRIKLAELYSKEQMRAEAIEEFIKAADYLRSHNRIDDFIKVAERLVYHQPDNVDVTKELAGLYLRRGDPRRALQKLQLAFKSNPRDDATLQMLAQAFQDLGQVGKTVSVLKELANIHAENGEEGKRQEVYRRILELVPGDPEALQVVGGAPQHAYAAPDAMQPNQFGGGAATNEPAGHTPPEQLPAAAFNDVMPAAAQPYQAQVQPHHAGASPATPGADDVVRIITEADVYIKYGLQDKAIDHLRQVFQRDPNNVDVRLKLRDLFVQTGRFAEASLELLAIGKLLTETDRQAAAQYLNEALELDNQNAPARALLSQLETAIEPGQPVVSTQPVEAVSQLREDTMADEFEEIDLENAEIVEEIPIMSADLIEAVVEEEPGIAASSEVAEGQQTDVELSNAGVIEISGETTDTLGAGTPSSEVIPLPVQSSSPVVHAPGDEESESSLEDDLEEAEFFLQQGLRDEARTILEDLASRFPANPLVQEKLAELHAAESARVSQSSAATPVFASSDSTQSLADELAAELSNVFDEEDHSVDYSVEDVFEEFKKGIHNQISDEDSDTHYDLGIAYREMGLFDDAIAEFKTAMRTKEKEVLCHMMIGLCHVEKGDTVDAVTQFKAGLYVDGVTDQESVALYYELGRAYERLDDAQEALYFYDNVLKKDPAFRDVGSRVDGLRGGGGAPLPSGGSEAKL